jgi:hypothetical protein
MEEKYAMPPNQTYEMHAANIDDSSGLDLAHAVLSFEFIYRINDDMLQHYVP